MAATGGLDLQSPGRVRTELLQTPWSRTTEAIPVPHPGTRAVTKCERPHWSEEVVRSLSTRLPFGRTARTVACDVCNFDFYPCKCASTELGKSVVHPPRVVDVSESRRLQRSRGGTGKQEIMGALDCVRGATFSNGMDWTRLLLMEKKTGVRSAAESRERRESLSGDTTMQSPPSPRVQDEGGSCSIISRQGSCYVVALTSREDLSQDLWLSAEELAALNENLATALDEPSFPTKEDLRDAEVTVRGGWEVLSPERRALLEYADAAQAGQDLRLVCVYSKAWHVQKRPRDGKAKRGSHAHVDTSAAGHHDKDRGPLFFVEGVAPGGLADSAGVRAGHLLAKAAPGKLVDRQLPGQHAHHVPLTEDALAPMLHHSGRSKGAGGMSWPSVFEFNVLPPGWIADVRKGTEILNAASLKDLADRQMAKEARRQELAQGPGPADLENMRKRLGKAAVTLGTERWHSVLHGHRTTTPGCFSWIEFQSLCCTGLLQVLPETQKSMPDDNAKLRQVFGHLDVQSRGKITMEEFSRFVLLGLTSVRFRRKPFKVISRQSQHLRHQHIWEREALKMGAMETFLEEMELLYKWSVKSRMTLLQIDRTFTKLITNLSAQLQTFEKDRERNTELCVQKAQRLAEVNLNWRGKNEEDRARDAARYKEELMNALACLPIYFWYELRDACQPQAADKPAAPPPEEVAATTGSRRGAMTVAYNQSQDESTTGTAFRRSVRAARQRSGIIGHHGGEGGSVHASEATSMREALLGCVKHSSLMQTVPGFSGLRLGSSVGEKQKQLDTEKKLEDELLAAIAEVLESLFAYVREHGQPPEIQTDSEDSKAAGSVPGRIRVTWNEQHTMYTREYGGRRDGRLDFGEFEKIIFDAGICWWSQSERKENFDSLDHDRSGFLSLGEVMQVSERMLVLVRQLLEYEKERQEESVSRHSLSELLNDFAKDKTDRMRRAASSSPRSPAGLQSLQASFRKEAPLVSNGSEPSDDTASDDSESALPPPLPGSVR